MRLIDADALIETMKRVETEYEDAMTCPSWWTAYSVISEQPTAYDVEKVAEGITDRMDHERDSQIRARKAGNIDASNIHKYGRCCLALAIDIVKAGGVE